MEADQEHLEAREDVPEVEKTQIEIENRSKVASPGGRLQLFRGKLVKFKAKYEHFFIIEAYYGGPTLVQEPLETLEARETPLEAALL